MLRKSIIISHKTINAIVVIVAALLFLICLYAMIDAYIVYVGANDSGIMKYKPESGNTEKLRELSENAVAWLTVDDTRIDYPVMQGENNTEYLNKAPNGEFSLSGSIFLDSRNDKTFSDPYSLIYGHHMEYGAMFGSATEKVIFDPPESNNQALLEYLNDHALIYDPSGVGAGLKLIALSTCQSAESNERMIVFGVLTPQNR